MDIAPKKKEQKKVMSLGDFLADESTFLATGKYSLIGMIANIM